MKSRMEIMNIADCLHSGAGNRAGADETGLIGAGPGPCCTGRLRAEREGASSQLGATFSRNMLPTFLFCEAY